MQVLFNATLFLKCYTTKKIKIRDQNSISKMLRWNEGRKLKWMESWIMCCDNIQLEI